MLPNFCLRTGYYQVGDSFFMNKIPAVIESSRRGIYPQWIFMNDLLDRHNWQNPLTQSLPDLYKNRCQQLRERYDYLTLSYSGGADSGNILQSFLNNRIQLDEILVVWPVRRSESSVVNPFDLSKKNYPSEWELTIKPHLKWIAKHYPKIKITVRDWGEELPGFSLKDDFLLKRSSTTSPYSVLRWHDRDRLDALGCKNGALIYGTDKPRLCIKDGWYHIYFIDNAVHSGNLPELDDFSNMVELFYWSPDTLDLVTKQSHALIDFFEAHPGMRHILDWPIQSHGHEQYRNIVKSIIYSGYNMFQVKHFAYDCILTDTELETDLQTLNYRAWQTVRSVVQDKFISSWDGQEQIIGMINGMWPLRQVSSITTV